jgi:uroporphyrinogen III methyltransferase/synthase
MLPEKFVAEAVVGTFKRAGSVAGLRILLPRTEIARSLIPDELRALGAHVTEVQAYVTKVEDHPDPAMLARLTDEPVDYVTFTSSSTARNFIACLGPERVAKVMARARCASIGPITTKTADDLGLEVAIEAKESTIRGLVTAILEDRAKAK